MSAAATLPLDAPAPPAAAIRTRQPQRPTLILPGFVPLVEFPTLGALAIRLRQLARPWPMMFRSGTACCYGFDSFPSVTVYAGGEYLATVAVQDATAADLEAACAQVAL